MDQMRTKMSSLQEEIDTVKMLNQQQQQQQSVFDQEAITIEISSTSYVNEESKLIAKSNNETAAQVDSDTQTMPIQGPINETDKMSIKHIDEEITELNRTMKKFIEDKMIERKRSMSLLPRRDSTQLPPPTPTTATTSQIVESENVEKLNIELQEKSQRISELEVEIEALNKRMNSIESSLARWIFRACDYKADLEKAKEKSSGAEIELEDAKNTIADFQSTLNQLGRELESKTRELSRYMGIECQDKETETDCVDLDEQCIQTESIDYDEVGIQTDAITKTTVIPSGLVAQQAAKLNELTQKNKVRHNSQDQVDTVSNTSGKNDLNTLRQKIDNLVLEKNSYKVRNDELMRELENVTHNLESLKKINKEYNSPIQSNSATNTTLIISKDLSTKTTQTNLTKLINQLVQTDFNVKICAKTHTTQSQTDHVQNTITSVLSKSSLLRQDAQREEMDQLKKEKIELEIKVNELTTEKYTNLRLNNELNEMKKQFDTERKEFEQKMTKLISDFNIKTQVSDTIIQQQKKLLHYLQTKINGKSGENDENHHHQHNHHSSGSNAQQSSNGTGNNIKKLFKVNIFFKQYVSYSFNVLVYKS